MRDRQGELKAEATSASGLRVRVCSEGSGVKGFRGLSWAVPLATKQLLWSVVQNALGKDASRTAESQSEFQSRCFFKKRTTHPASYARDSRRLAAAPDSKTEAAEAMEDGNFTLALSKLTEACWPFEHRSGRVVTHGLAAVKTC